MLRRCADGLLIVALTVGMAAGLASIAPAQQSPAQQSPVEVRERALEVLQSGDLPTAAQMLVELGDSGVPQGYTMLGEIKRDLGDNGDAARWFERGAEGGDVMAMLQGGAILSDPISGLNDPRRAFPLWLAAANRGAARGQFKAGQALMDGTGIRADPKTGADWLEKAAAQCVGEAQLAYGQALREGKGREADGEEAFAWLIAGERAKDDWGQADLEHIATLQRDISAYMSSEQVTGAYCRGLALFSESCGGGGILFRIERWRACG